jgi:hypothetical protein
MTSQEIAAALAAGLEPVDYQAQLSLLDLLEDLEEEDRLDIERGDSPHDRERHRPRRRAVRHHSRRHQPDVQRPIP